ncbi:MAG: hypothetical protein OEY64_07820 [Nitrospinota bacterium]|nr:hypothetical protein [Nitrospinota bacterium]
MAELYSQTAYARLPSEIKKLSKDAQTACISLRLRKTEEQIARETGIDTERVTELADEVRRTLILNGKYDLISDPVFIPLDSAEVEPSSNEGAGPEEKIVLGKFLKKLEESLQTLPVAEKQLLHLFFQQRMSAQEIAGFMGKLGNVRGKSEAEVFGDIEKAVRKLLSSIEESTPLGRGTLTVKGLKEILHETGVEA